MGFATGLKTGAGLVQQVMDNERQSRIDARADDEYAYKIKQRNAEDEAVANVQFPGGGLNTTSPVTNAPPASVAATGGDGVPPTPPALPGAGLVTGTSAPPAANLPAAGAAPAAAGLSTDSPAAPAANLPAAPADGAAPPAANLAPAAPVRPMSDEMKLAQGMFNVAKAKKDVAGMNAAVDQYHVANRKDIINDAAQMSDDAAFAYMHQNVNKVGSLPMSIVKEGKDGYRVTAWADDGGKGASALLDSAEVKKLVAADMMMKKGYGSEGLDLAGTVNKGLNDVIKSYNEGTKDQATIANTVAHNRATDANARAQTAISGARLGLEREKFNQEKWKPIGPSEDNKGLMMMDAQGNMKINPLPAGSDAKQIWSKISGASNKAPGADKAAPEAGTILQRPDNTRYKDGGTDPVSGRKIELGVNSVMPEARTQTLVKGGLPAGAAEQMQWTTDGPAAGQHVFYNGKYYSAKSPNDPDIADLVKDWKRDQRTGKTSDEIANSYSRDRYNYEHPELARKRGLQLDEDAEQSANPAFN